MLAWIIIYCTEPIDAVAADELLADIRLNDYPVLVADYGVKESLVEPALAQLRVESRGDEFWLWYKEDTSLRPVIIQRWLEKDRLAEEVAAAESALGGLSPDTAKEVRQLLADAKGVVGIELGIEQRQDMGIVLAYEVARWLAENYGGIIHGDDGTWSIVNEGAFQHLE